MKIDVNYGYFDNMKNIKNIEQSRTLAFTFCHVGRGWLSSIGLTSSAFISIIVSMIPVVISRWHSTAWTIVLIVAECRCIPFGFPGVVQLTLVRTWSRLWVISSSATTTHVWLALKCNEWFINLESDYVVTIIKLQYTYN